MFFELQDRFQFERPEVYVLETIGLVVPNKLSFNLQNKMFDIELFFIKHF